MAGYFSVNLGCFTLDPGVQNPWGPPYRKLLYKFEARFFPRVTPEPGLQFHANFNVGLCHVLNTLSCEEHDLRLLRKALFPGRYWAVSHAKTAFLSLGYRGNRRSGTVSVHCTCINLYCGKFPLLGVDVPVIIKNVVLSRGWGCWG